MASTSVLCFTASFGHGRTSTVRSSCESASLTRLQNGHASNSYRMMGSLGTAPAGRAMHASSTLEPNGRRAMDAKPLVATSSVRFRGAAASPPPNTFRSGQRNESTDRAVGFSSSSAPAARVTRERRPVVPRDAFRGSRAATRPVVLSARAAMVAFRGVAGGHDGWRFIRER